MTKSGVFHAQAAGTDVLAKINVEILSAHRLDRLADEIDVDAVFPALARIEGERCLERRILAADDARELAYLLYWAVSASQMS